MVELETFKAEELRTKSGGEKFKSFIMQGLSDHKCSFPVRALNII